MKKPAVRYVLGTVYAGTNPAVTMQDLMAQGWKNLHYVSHDSWGDCRAPEIMGDRPMTSAEIKAADQAILLEREQDLRELKRLAKKLGYTLTKHS